MEKQKELKEQEVVWELVQVEEATHDEQDV